MITIQTSIILKLIYVSCPLSIEVKGQQGLTMNYASSWVGGIGSQCYWIVALEDSDLHLVGVCLYEL